MDIPRYDADSDAFYYANTITVTSSWDVPPDWEEPNATEDATWDATETGKLATAAVSVLNIPKPIRRIVITKKGMKMLGTSRSQYHIAS
jgi:hypothetical protein